LLARKRKRKNQFKKDRLNRRAVCFRYICSGLTLVGVAVFMLLLSSAFIFGYDFVTQHRYFRIEAVQVDGILRLSDKAVIRRAGIKVGSNIFSVNLTAARKRLLAHPLIAEARVRRILPAHIEVVVKEHQPLAILDLGRKFTINAQGVIYKEADQSDFELLPEIVGLEFTDIQVPGQPSSAAFEAVMEVLRLGQEVSCIVPNSAIRKIYVDHHMGLTLQMTQSIRILKLGFDNYKVKYERLVHLLDYLKAKPGFSDLEAIDLNNLKRVVVCPSAGNSPANGHKEV